MAPVLGGAFAAPRRDALDPVAATMATTDSTSARPSVAALPIAAEALTEFVRGLFTAIEPSWPFRPALAYELGLVFEAGTGSTRALRSKGAVAIAAPIVEPSALVAEIRSTLSLNIAETARVLGVERPTIYAWIAGRSTPQRGNVLRLIRVANVAAAWRRQSEHSLGDLVRSPGTNGASIVDLMSLDPIPDGVIQERFRVLSAEAPAPVRGRRDVADIARRHGLAVTSRPEAQAHIDWLTRRPLGAEEP